MNTFGQSLKLSIFGESHGPITGITIDGCPAGLKIDESEFNTDLARRKSGKIGTTPRKELDQPEIISGIYKSYTTGAPITIIFKNKDIKMCQHGLLDIDGVTIDYAHHGPFPGSRSWLKGNIARYYLRDLMMREIMNGNSPPKLVVRAHYHTPVEEYLKIMVLKYLVYDKSH